MKTIPGIMSGIILAIAVITPSNATSIQTLTTREASGEFNVPQIRIPRGHSINLSFIPSGETIRQVRLDDRSRILVRFDAPLCRQNQSDCKAAGASVVTMSQLAQPINFSPNERNAYRQDGEYRTTLTVVTTRGRQQALYTFELILVDNSTTSVRTIQIVRQRTQPVNSSIPQRPSRP